MQTATDARDNPADGLKKVRPELNEHRRYFLMHPWALFWHPHEGAWNRNLVKALPRPLRRLPIWLDTLIRYAGIALRTPSGGVRHPKARLVLLDLGLHSSAAQSVQMIDWFGKDWRMLVLGFEAHPEFAENARAKIEAAARDKPDVVTKVENLALVGPDSDGGVVKLFLDGKKGLGNSLFQEKGVDEVEVQGARLSERISLHGVDPSKDIIILRMNIEGAEKFVIDDLVAAGLADQITGYYGMWNDLFKISPDRDAEFRRMCAKNRINPFPFNDRDIKDSGKGNAVLRLRRKMIRLHLLRTIERQNAALVNEIP